MAYFILNLRQILLQFCENVSEDKLVLADIQLTEIELRRIRAQVQENYPLLLYEILHYLCFVDSGIIADKHESLLICRTFVCIREINELYKLLEEFAIKRSFRDIQVHELGRIHAGADMQSLLLRLSIYETFLSSFNPGFLKGVGLADRILIQKLKLNTNSIESRDN